MQAVRAKVTGWGLGQTVVGPLPPETELGQIRAGLAENREALEGFQQKQRLARIIKSLKIIMECIFGMGSVRTILRAVFLLGGCRVRRPALVVMLGTSTLCVLRL